MNDVVKFNIPLIPKAYMLPKCDELVLAFYESNKGYPFACSTAYVSQEDNSFYNAETGEPLQNVVYWTFPPKVKGGIIYKSDNDKFSKKRNFR